MENVFNKVDVKQVKTDKYTKINDYYMRLKENLNEQDIKDFKNCLISMSSNPIFTNKSAEFTQASASFVIGDNRAKRHKLMYLMTLLEDKSGKKVFSITSGVETSIMCVNPTQISMMQVSELIFVTEESTTEEPTDDAVTEEPTDDAVTEESTTEEPTDDAVTEESTKPSAKTKSGKK